MKPDFNKQPLIPAIIQDANTLQVLMLGYMNEEALEKTQKEGKVTFFSRSKNRLWTKGETSGNHLWVKEIFTDCDRDTILIRAQPAGPTCHRGTTACFDNDSPRGFLYRLEQIIAHKIDTKEDGSYTSALYSRGINKVAQKVGEEAVEVVIEAKDNNPELFKNECADLLYHLLILLKAKGHELEDIEQVLLKRNRDK